MNIISNDPEYIEKIKQEIALLEEWKANFHMDKERLEKIQVIILHGEVFHADETYATATVQLAMEEIGKDPSTVEILRPLRAEVLKVIAQKKLELGEEAVLVMDVGGGLYDHHDQVKCRKPWIQIKCENDRRLREPYAAFGKIWISLGYIFGLNRKFVDRIDEQFVCPLDVNDNCGVGLDKPNPMAMAIRHFNIKDVSKINEQNEAFIEALEFTKGVMKRLIRTTVTQQKSYIEDGVEELEKNAKNGIIISDKYFDSSLVDDRLIKAVVMPAVDKVRYMVKATNNYRMRIMPLDEMPEEVQAQLKEDDHLFIHKTGFLCNVKDKPTAIMIAENYLKPEPVEM